MQSKYLVILILIFTITNFLFDLIVYYERASELSIIKKSTETNQEYLKEHILNLRSRIDIIIEKQDSTLQKLEITK